MIKKLYRHLVFMFTIATSLILTLLLCVAFFNQFSQTDKRAEAAFQSQMADLRRKLELDSDFSDDWLARLEAEGRLIIHIEENGRPLFFSGSWIPSTDRNTLIERAKEQALLEQVDTAHRPFSYSSQESSVFTVKGEAKDQYLGSVIVISVETGYRSLVLLLDVTSQREGIKWQCLLFLLLEFLGILALYLVSRLLVGRAVKPVEEYHQKQTEFVAAASHELRSPLAVIQASASAIPVMPDQASHMAEVIQRECVRTGKMVKELLLLASLDEEKDLDGKDLNGKDLNGRDQDGKDQEAEVDRVLLNLLEAYEPLCGEKGIRLHLKLPEEILPPVKGKESWIYQILAIFLDNAIAYGCPKGEPAAPEIKEPGIPRENKSQEILITAKREKDQIFIAVSDHGPGIPEVWKKKIFERFSRMDASRKDKEHFGLGLSIAAGLARRMKARLEIRDTQGGGSTFCIWMGCQMGKQQ